MKTLSAFLIYFPRSFLTLFLSHTSSKTTFLRTLCIHFQRVLSVFSSAHTNYDRYLLSEFKSRLSRVTNLFMLGPIQGICYLFDLFSNCFFFLLPLLCIFLLSWIFHRVIYQMTQLVKRSDEMPEEEGGITCIACMHSHGIGSDSQFYFLATKITAKLG